MFQAPKLTNAGKALYYDNMAGTQLKFTTIKLGSGTLSGSIANLTNLVNTVVTIDATATKYEDYATVAGSFSNAQLAEGFYWREIGVFAANPSDPDNRAADILYCYQNAYDTADFIPVASVETVEKNITVPVIVGDATAVSCTLSKSLVFVTQQELEDQKGGANGLASLDANGKITPTQVDYLLKTIVAAADYDPTATYAAGAYCIKAGTLYKCTTPITVAEAWNAAHWAATSMGAEIAALYTALAGKAAANHTHTAEDVGADPSGAAAAVQTNLTAHVVRTDNPHGVTRGQIGAAAVDHTHTAAQVGADPTGSAAGVYNALSPTLRLNAGLGNEYLWRRYLTGYAPVLAATSNVTILMRGDWYTYRIKYSATLDPTTGNMVNPAMVEFSNTSNDITRISVVKGMYWCWAANNGIPPDLPTYFTDASANITVAWVDNYGNNYTIPSHQLTFVNQDYNVSYVNSNSPTAYPISDGYAYDGPISLGAKADIFFTQYGGSGTYGSSAPNTLVFPFKPKFVIICLVADTYNSSRGPFWGDRNSGTTYGFSWCVGQTVGFIDGSNITFTQTGKTLSWYSQNYSAQLNQAGRVYNVIAF